MRYTTHNTPRGPVYEAVPETDKDFHEMHQSIMDPRNGMPAAERDRLINDLKRVYSEGRHRRHNPYERFQRFDFEPGPAMHFDCQVKLDTAILSEDEAMKPKPKRKGKQAMNYSTHVMLINKNIRAIQTIYDAEVNGKVPQRYTFKTLDQDLKVGDYVIVPSNTRLGFTTNKVVAVDVDVDFDANYELKWVVAKFDLKQYEDVMAMEAKAISVIKKGELRKRREDILKNTFDAATAGEIENLEIAKLGAPEPKAEDAA